MEWETAVSSGSLGGGEAEQQGGSVAAGGWSDLVTSLPKTMKTKPLPTLTPEPQGAVKLVHPKAWLQAC